MNSPQEGREILIMRLDDIRGILITIELATYGDKPITRHHIAKNITAWSRSTTYRKVNKLIGLGLVGMARNENECDLYITPKGQSFLNSFVKLKGLEQNDKIHPYSTK